MIGSTVAPASRFSKTAETGILVPRKTQAPFSLPGTLSTAVKGCHTILRSDRFPHLRIALIDVVVEQGDEFGDDLIAAQGEF